MKEDRQSRLIGQIYDASFDASLWVSVMEQLAEELSGDVACMTSLDIYTGNGAGFAALVPDQTMGVYFSQWAQKNPLHEVGDPLCYLKAWQPATIRYEDWIKRSILQRSDFYNEFLRPIGAENGIMMGLALTGTITTTMNIARSLRRNVFDDDEMVRARYWQRHLGRAVRLGHEMKMTQAAFDAMDHLLQNTYKCLYFADTNGRIQRMSLAAEDLLISGSVLRRVSGILTATSVDEDCELKRLIVQASSSDSTTLAGGAMRLQGDRGEYFELTVSPLTGRSAAVWSTEPIICVTVSVKASPDLPFELKLRDRFGLTPAEARLALALMKGGTLREVAESAARSIRTVRAQLGTIFSKTGCNRQADLIRTLLCLDQGSDSANQVSRRVNGFI